MRSKIQDRRDFKEGKGGRKIEGHGAGNPNCRNAAPGEIYAAALTFVIDLCDHAIFVNGVIEKQFIQFKKATNFDKSR